MNRKPSESVEDDDDMDVEEVDSDEWDEEGEGDPVPANECIFCSHNSKVLFGPVTVHTQLFKLSFFGRVKLNLNLVQTHRAWTLFQDLENNVIHMTERHSFFLPDAEYLTDLEGIMCYLGEKVRRVWEFIMMNDQDHQFLLLRNRHTTSFDIRSDN